MCTDNFTLKDNIFMEIVVCPMCHSKFTFNVLRKELICNVDNLIFPIKKGIPILLINKAYNVYLLK